MTWVPDWLAGVLGRGRHERPPSACRGPDGLASPAPEGPGPVVRAVAAVCYLVPLLTFILCLAAMLFCLVSLVAGLFTG